VFVAADLYLLSYPKANETGAINFLYLAILIPIAAISVVAALVAIFMRKRQKRWMGENLPRTSPSKEEKET
jgi:hypothetical protein